MFKIFCADHTYTTLKMSMDATVEDIIKHSQAKLGLEGDLVICEVKSTGGMSCNKNIVDIPTF